MKSWPAALVNHLALKVTTIAYCWKVTRPDAVVFGFTNHQKDITVSGVTYKAATGFQATEVATRAALNVDDMNVEGVLDSAGITNADILAGLWDFAQVEIFVVNYENVAGGIGQGRKGNLGEVRRSRNTFVAELRGLMQRLQQRTGREVTAGCPWDLGDSHCGINLNTFTNGKVSTTVTSVDSQRQFTATGLTQAAGWFEGGNVVFTTGPNIGVFRLREIKTHSAGGVITLQLTVPYPITIGDAFTATVGDLKRRDEDCRDKFNNVINFGGFPDVPGRNRIISGL